MQNLITVKQLPIIEEKILTVKGEVAKRLNKALALEVSEDTVKEVKKFRAELNKEFAEFEDIRKKVKSEILAPYENFEALYKECITDGYKKADSELKVKIWEHEDCIKEQKKEVAKGHFEAYARQRGLAWLDYKMMGQKIGLSDSQKMLLSDIEIWIDGIVGDLALIDTQLYADEIMYEYKQTLDVHESIKKVLERMKELSTKPVEKEKEVVEEVIEEKADKYYAIFKVKGTERQLKAISNFMKQLAEDYEVLEQGEAW